MPFTLVGNSDVLFKYGKKSIDFRPENEGGCLEGYEQRTLYPNKHCKDNFYLTDDSTLVLNDTSKYGQGNYTLNKFCISPNGNAKTKHDHFAMICVKVKEKGFKMS